jgi:hypothetical protein
MKLYDDFNINEYNAEDYDVIEIECPHCGESIELERVFPICLCSLYYAISGRCQCYICKVEDCNKRGKCLE